MKKAFCFNICSCHSLWQNLSTSDLRIASVTSVEKRELQEHFSASAYGLSFKKFSFSSLFSTSVTSAKLKSDVDKFCLRRGKHKYRNKILELSYSMSWQAKYDRRYDIKVKLCFSKNDKMLQNNKKMKNFSFFENHFLLIFLSYLW